MSEGGRELVILQAAQADLLEIYTRFGERTEARRRVRHVLVDLVADDGDAVLRGDLADLGLHVVGLHGPRRVAG